MPKQASVRPTPYLWPPCCDIPSQRQPGPPLSAAGAFVSERVTEAGTFVSERVTEAGSSLPTAFQTPGPPSDPGSVSGSGTTRLPRAVRGNQHARTLASLPRV